MEDYNLHIYSNGFTFECYYLLKSPSENDGCYFNYSRDGIFNIESANDKFNEFVRLF